MRSLLFVPADSPRKLAKALHCGADALLIDLEDSVAPGQKAVARLAARQFVADSRGKSDGPLLLVRVNGAETGMIDDDLDAVMQPGLTAILLPKCCGGRDVQQLSAKMAVREAIGNHPPGTFKIVAIATETAASLFAMGSFAGASRRLLGLTWGAEDLSADIGAMASMDQHGNLTGPYAMARTLTLVAAAAAKVAAIDTVFTAIADEVGLRATCAAAARDGFVGKMAIHPNQVAIINKAFTPDAVAVDRAMRIVDAFAADSSLGVVVIDGQMIDGPHLVRARKTLARAAALKS